MNPDQHRAATTGLLDIGAIADILLALGKHNHIHGTSVAWLAKQLEVALEMVTEAVDAGEPQP